MTSKNGSLLNYYFVSSNYHRFASFPYCSSIRIACSGVVGVFFFLFFLFLLLIHTPFNTLTGQCEILSSVKIIAVIALILGNPLLECGVTFNTHHVYLSFMKYLMLDISMRTAFREDRSPPL